MTNMNVTSLMTLLTAPENILKNVYSLLRQVDPDLDKNLEAYQAAVTALEEGIGDSVIPSTIEYIAASEKEIAAELLYVAWLGFQQNIDCFQNPVNTLMLRRDYEEIHREYRMHTLPDVQEALIVKEAFHAVLRKMPEEKRLLVDGISDFVIYLDTKGYKIAHYFGFLVADSFLYHVIPGYAKDTFTTGIYSWGIEDFLKIHLDPLR